MQKTKKQKYEQQVRRGLKTIMNLQPQLVQFLKNIPSKSDNLLNKTYPYIHGLNLLRIFTLMEINYIIFAFLDVIQKTKAMKVENLKIGVIGGGVMGRLIINSLLVFTRQGLKSQNILVSSRQHQHLKFYAQNFGVKTFFDNERIAKQADIVFIATPATLDNWIIVDIKKHVESRLNFNSPYQTNRTSYASTILVQNTEPLKMNGSPSTKSDLEKEKKGTTESISQFKASKKTINQPKEQPVNINPLIYILTSDFTKQKAKKLFGFPVITPWIRALDISKILQKMKNHLANQQVAELKDSEKIIKSLETFMSLQLLVPGQNSIENDGKQSQSAKVQNIIQKIINALSFSCKKLENQWQRETLTSKNKIDFENVEKDKLYKEVLQSQNKSYIETFLTKSRKWRMAYNNFIV